MYQQGESAVLLDTTSAKKPDQSLEAFHKKDISFHAKAQPNAHEVVREAS